MGQQPGQHLLDKDAPHPGSPQIGVSSFLRQRKDAIVRAWERRVTSEQHEVKLTGLVLRDDIPDLLDELAAWMTSDATPETSPVATRARAHVIQRLDAGLALAQVFREYRLLREVLFEEMLRAEAAEQREGALGEGGREARITELARLNAGLDVVLSQSIEQFIEERERRAAAERASAAETAAELETKYHSLFESIDQGFCVVEVLFEGERPVDYRFRSVNSAFVRLTGIENATGKRVSELIQTDGDQQRIETYGRVAQTGLPVRVEFAAPSLGRIYEVYAYRVGKPEQRRVAVLFNDIKQRRQAEENLKKALAEAESQQRLLDVIMDNVPEGIVIAEAPEVRIRRVSRYCQILTGKPLEVIEGISVAEHVQKWDIFNADGVTAARNEDLPLTRATQNGEVVRDEEWVLGNSSGERIPILCNASPIRDSAGAITGGITAWRDITDRKRAEQALKHANLLLSEADRRKNDFISVLSHELRNPLAPITNSLYIMDHAAPGGAQAERAKQVIHRQVTQLSHLVNDLLDVTRIAHNKVHLVMKGLDLNEVVRQAVEDNQSIFERAGVRLELLLAPLPVPVHADNTRIAQVVGNLLQNAAKFTSKGGQTRVSVAVEGGEAVVRVADDGVGMSRETLDHLFQPFSQAEQSRDRAKGGLGLGLALVKGLVELHGGSVSARSDGLGHGVEMIVRLILDPGAALEGAAQRTLAAIPRRVLIIEDNEDAADSLGEFLAFGGHEVAVAYSGLEGIAKAREFLPDVVLCDIGLPGMDGYDVARVFRSDEALKAVFLVALSGYALPEDLQQAAEAGFHRHLAKPPSLNMLNEILAGRTAAAVV